MGHGDGLRDVARAEEDHVGQERVEPVEAYPVAPTGGERTHFVVRAEDPLELGQAEEAEHGQVGLAVTAMSRRIDQVHAVRAPDDVAGPQVAVDTAGLLRRVVVRSGLQPDADLLEDL